MSILKVQAIHEPDNDNEALTIDQSGNVTFSANVDMSAGTVTGIDTSNGDTAFSWGDHAQAGYLTTETYTGTLSNIVEDTSPQLGGNLDLNSSNITGTGNISITGNVTAGDVTVDNIVPSTQLSHRNIIINGAMQVAQRGTSSTGITGGSYPTVDRWQFQEAGSAVVTMTQENSGTRPVGFDKFARIEITTADSTTDSGDRMSLKTTLETQDVHCLNYGTSDAKDVTLSFWVRSSISGTYSIAVYHQASTSYSYSTSYTIDSANTWEYKTITIPGHTTQAHDNDDTVAGLQIRWMLSAGSSTTQTADTWQSGNYWGVSGQTNLSETLNAIFDLTGVQLEVGSVATPFEHRSYGEELKRCQRYFFNAISAYTNNNQFTIVYADASSSNTGWVTFQVPFPVSMRTIPTFSHSVSDSNLQVNPTGNTWCFYTQNQAHPGKVGSVNMNVLNAAASESYSTVGAYYAATSQPASAIKFGDGITLTFDAEI